jgi:hypothetical protein
MRFSRRLKEVRSIWRAASMDESRDEWFEAFNASFAALRADPIASADHDAEVALWDTTLLDGLAEWPFEDTPDR